MGFRFVRNRAFQSGLQTDPRYRAALLAQVNLVVVPHVKARADAAGEPFMPSGGRAITTSLSETGVVVANTDHGALIAELGSPSQNTPASAPLRGGAHDAGLRVREE